MEWLKTLVWIFRGGEKDLIVLVIFVVSLMLWLPLDYHARHPGTTESAARIEKQEVQ